MKLVNTPTTLEITLRNGTTVSGEVTSWKWKKGFTTELEWTTPDSARRRLVTVDVDEIVAIVEVK